MLDVTEKSWWRKIWDNNVAREIILLAVSVVATQLAFSANELLGIVETAKDLGDIWTGLSTWSASFLFALIQNGIKQAVASAMAWAAGRRLAGPGSS